MAFEPNTTFQYKPNKDYTLYQGVCDYPLPFGSPWGPIEDNPKYTIIYDPKTKLLHVYIQTFLPDAFTINSPVIQYTIRNELLPDLASINGEIYSGVVALVDDGYTTTENVTLATCEVIAPNGLDITITPSYDLATFPLSTTNAGHRAFSFIISLDAA